ncbi:hypothetical protein [Pseudorhodoferax sp. Leaf267]|uniref:hypothetical protein n=1 Tax=Pseudorhodoferax sp. Leaf267 TaxID=1736316 RepID=UPI00071603DB|nr:hypothetical protein [Pseudorhodoferax sp. Leaf267]KQP12651.1 hypothetical protein ASF43_20655 [Pseudorhodoferax sp. Leaf267]
MKAAWLRRSAWPRGAAGLALAGALLAVAALAAEWWLTAPLRAQREALEAVAVPAPRAAATRAALASPATQLQQFHAAFPRMDELPEALASLDAVARRAGVALRSGEYRIEQRADAANGRLTRYRIVLRSAGDYAQIRGFIGVALEQLHFVGLDDVQFRRGADAGSALEADVRLSLYLQR